MALDLIAGPGGGSQAVRDSSSVAIAEGGSAFDLTADSLVTGEDVAVMIDLANAGAVSGTLGSLRAATVRYDYRNQMVEYAADDGFGPHTYLYDALGRRVAKRVADAGSGQIVGTRFVSAGNTRSAASWQTIEEYYEGAQMLTASYIHGNYIDEVLSMRRDADGSGAIREYFVHQDDLFNVTLVTDAAGAAVERYEYGDYGGPRFFDGGGAALGASALGNARLFNGREWDAEVAMYHYRTRYLEPSLGRFTVRDLIGVWGDEGNVGNGVAYVESNPLLYFDAFGEQATDSITATFEACLRMPTLEGRAACLDDLVHTLGPNDPRTRAIEKILENVKKLREAEKNRRRLDKIKRTHREACEAMRKTYTIACKLPHSCVQGMGCEAASLMLASAVSCELGRQAWLIAGCARYDDNPASQQQHESELENARNASRHCRTVLTKECRKVGCTK